MITKQEILERAKEWNLRPEVVEKDYVLGWILAASSSHPVVRESWVLKGGTCVKKCFFETYRFSEDLDYTLLPDAPYDEESIVSTLRELAELTENLSGIRFSQDQFNVKLRRDKFGRATFEGRLGYQGPLAVPGWPRILFDITRHEPVILATARRAVLHPYSDSLPRDIGVQTYSFEELLAEKTRALFERTRPRDLYDVAYILDNIENPLNSEVVRTTFREKCRIKEFEAPTAAEIVARVRSSQELRVDWDDMLSHQLPYVAPADGAVERLERALSWLVVESTAQIVGSSSRLASAPVPARQGEIVAPATVRGGITEQLRFAGANRLLLGFNYHGKPRTVEPYSLRWAESTGNLNLYAWEISAGQIKCFTTSKMSNVHIVQQTFTPRYHVELGSGAAVAHTPWRW